MTVYYIVYLSKVTLIMIIMILLLSNQIFNCIINVENSYFLY